MRKLFLILSVLCRVTAVHPQAGAVAKPHILFILVDDMGYGDLGVFFQNARKERNDRSEPWFSTPHLDRLAARGVMLTDHYCAAPVCAPSRASLLTGLSQGHAAIRDNQFDKALPDQYTLGSLLQKAGYATAAIGKWGLQGEGKGPDWPAHPLKRGFDYFFGYMRHRDGHEHYPKEGVYRAKAEVWENRKNMAADLDNCYTGDLWTAVTKRWIRQHLANSQQPFFIYLAFDTPHAALELPTQAYPAGGGLKGGMQWLDKPGKIITTADGKPDSWMDPEYATATWDADHNPATPEVPWPDTYKRYATIIGRIDQQVGDLLQLLTDLHIDRQTLVVFTSDNGPSRESYLPRTFVDAEPDFFNSFGPFDGIKRDVLEGGVRVPALVAWPGKLKSSSVMKSPSAFQDWLPTLAQAAGMPVPAFSDGKSFWPLLLTGKEDPARSVYIEYFEPNRTPAYREFYFTHQKRTRGQMQFLRRGDTVALRYDIQSHKDDFEIYDIRHDPQQVNDLARHPDLSAYQQKLKDETVSRRMPDLSAKRPYDSIFLAGIRITAERKEGFVYRFYKGNFLWIPSPEGIRPERSGRVNDPAGIKMKKEDSGLICLQGYFEAPADGLYSFTVNQAETFLLKMHDALLFNNDENFKGEYRSENQVRLQKGLHPFKVYVLKKKNAGLNVPKISWKGPGGKEMSFFQSCLAGD